MAFWNKKKEVVYTQSDVDSLRRDIATNASQAEGMRKRLASAISGTYDNADTLHNIYLDYGYPTELQFSNYWNMFRRFGIAKNVVELPVDTCWISHPEIDGSDKFNTAFESLSERIKFWHRMKGLDNRQRVGRYAGMFMRAKDGKRPEEPLEGTLGGELALVEIMPLYESQLQVLTVDDDVTSESYGMPTMYEFNGSAEGSRNEKISNNFNIHPSRLVLASEGADDGGIYGISSLEAPYNSLMDLRKIMGAGGEGFYKNASKDVVFELKDASSAMQNRELLKEFNDNYDDWAANRSRRSIWTPGLEAKTLDSNLVNPKEFFFNCLYDVSAATKTAATIIIGQQTGRMASTEDTSQYLTMNQSRRENFLTELVESQIDWFIRYGILPASEYTVTWDDLLASSDKEQLSNAKEMTLINKQSFDSGGDQIFTGEEVREAAGYEGSTEEFDDDDLSEELPDVDDNEDG